MTISDVSVCFLCSSIPGSSLVSVPWHSLSLHWPLAISWTSDTTKSREQRGLVLCLLPVAIASPDRVLLTKSFFLWSSGHQTLTHIFTKANTDHSKVENLSNHSILIPLSLSLSLRPTFHPFAPSSSHLDSPWFSVTDLKKKTLTRVSVFPAVFTLLQPWVVWWPWLHDTKRWLSWWGDADFYWWNLLWVMVRFYANLIHLHRKNVFV